MSKSKFYIYLVSFMQFVLFYNLIYIRDPINNFPENLKGKVTMNFFNCASYNITAFICN